LGGVGETVETAVVDVKWGLKRESWIVEDVCNFGCKYWDMAIWKAFVSVNMSTIRRRVREKISENALYEMTDLESYVYI
jgi:hypothetical protein